MLFLLQISISWRRIECNMVPYISLFYTIFSAFIILGVGMQFGNGHYATINNQTKLIWGFSPTHHADQNLLQIYKPGPEEELPLLKANDSSYSLSRRKRQLHNPCPSGFEVMKSYCIRVTQPSTWTTAYHDCFLHGIEKTSFDVKNIWNDFNSVNEIKKLVNQRGASVMWLTAQRKVEGGPLYYSGPVQSDFNYNNASSAIDFDVRWAEGNDMNKCLALDFTDKTLNMKSCDENFPFVCIFPLDFWTQNITYDSFKTLQNESIMWSDVKDECKKLQGDLIYTGMENYNAEVKKRTPLKSYTGNQNTVLQDENLSRQVEWFKNKTLHDGMPIFQIFYKGFQITYPDENKRFDCIKKGEDTDPKLVIYQHHNNNLEYNIETYNVHEISKLYGIKCYLNGQCIKNDEKAVVRIPHQGYLFCEALTHMPTKIITSDSLWVGNIKTISFASEILVEGERYNFTLHDLTFSMADEGSVSYYSSLLQQRLSAYHISIFNVTQRTDKLGIIINFHIETKEETDEKLVGELYSNVSRLLNLTAAETESKNVIVEYIRNTKFCLEGITLTNLPRVGINILWPLTPLGNFSECALQDMILRRECTGNFSTGAIWKEIVAYKSNTSSDIRQCIPNETFERTITLINEITERKYHGINNHSNTTTEFIKQFQELIFEKEVNETKSFNNKRTTIYSAPIKKDTKGYFLSQREKFKEIPSTERVMKKDVIFAVYVKLKINISEQENISISLSLFENNTIFPYSLSNYERISPVLLYNISDVNAITYPFQVSFSLEKFQMSINEKHLSPRCGFWNEANNRWEVIQNDKFEGVTDNGLFKCQYYHLTCFALLVNGEEQGHSQELEIISKIGCYISLIGGILVILMFLLRCRWRDKKPEKKLIFSLSISLCLIYLLFLEGVTQTSNETLCVVIGCLLHYNALSSFIWMLGIAYHMYLKFIKVFDKYMPSRFMLKVSACALIVPAVPTILILSLDLSLYKSDTYCWIHSEGLYFAFLLPIGLIWLSNLTVFIVILRKIYRPQFKTTRAKSNSTRRSQVILSFFLFVMLGLSWIFGFFSQFHVILSYFFCLTTTVQGLLVFLFYVLLEKGPNRTWIAFFDSCKERKKSVVSDRVETSQVTSSSI